MHRGNGISIVPFFSTGDLQRRRIEPSMSPEPVLIWRIQFAMMIGYHIVTPGGLERAASPARLSLKRLRSRDLRHPMPRQSPIKIKPRKGGAEIFLTALDQNDRQIVSAASRLRWHV
jgi:hypothetical protein